MGRQRAKPRRREPPIDRQPGWTRLDWLLLVVISAGAAVVRIAGLARPVGFVFDEVFYAQNACRYVGAADCGLEQLASRAHPPLGNWIIGAGIKLFGFDDFGWRIPEAVAGTLTVALLYLLMRRLLRDWAPPVAASVGAAAAAALLAGDFLHLVQSRVGMLDASLTFFVVAAVLFAVLDRDRPRHPVSSPRAVAWLRGLALGRPWRLVAGAALGAATAVKWSGAYLALGLIPLIVAWEITARRRDADGRPRGWRAAAWLAIRDEAPRSLVLLGIVPILVYLASYIGRMPGELVGLPWQEGTVWRGIWDHQQAMLTFHTSLPGNHPYESAPWSWLLLKRPVAYYFAIDRSGYRAILAMGDPLTWWPALLALIGLSVAWVILAPDARHPMATLLVAAAATYLPWLVLSGNRNQVFLWYILPTVPFLLGSLGVFAAWAWSWWPARILGGAYAAVVLAAFLFFFPILTALPVQPDAWRARMWLTDCARPGAETLSLPNAQISSGPPPAGWCWI